MEKKKKLNEKEAYRLMIKEAKPGEDLFWNEGMLVKNITKNKTYWEIIKVYWICEACENTGCSLILPKKCPYCNSTRVIKIGPPPEKVEPNFIECESVESANKVNLDNYRLVNYSDRRNVYVFCKRAKK